MLKSASKARGPSLSKCWEVGKAHQGAYSGGKIQLSSDGTYVACLYEHNVSFLDLNDGVVKKRLRGEESAGASEEIVSFALHPNGAEIVTASRNLLLRHWIIATGECRRTMKAHKLQVLCMDYDSTGTLVATGSGDRTVMVWDIERGYCTHSFRGHNGIISVVAFHPDPKRLHLVSASEDNSVRVWDLTKNECKAVLEAHLSYVTSVAFIPGGSGLVTGGRDRVLNLWDTERKELLKTFPVYEEVEGLQIVPEGPEFAGKFPAPRKENERSVGRSLVAVAGKKGVVRVFSLETPAGLVENSTTAQTKKRSSGTKLSCKCIMRQDNEAALHKAGYTHLLLNARVGGLIAVTSDHNLVMLEPRAGDETPLGATTLVSRRQIVGYNDEVIDIKSIPRGAPTSDNDVDGEAESRIVVATNSPQVRLFDLDRFACRLLDGHTDTVLAVDVAPDGRHLCTSSKDRSCLLWDLDLGVPVVRWSGHADAVGAIAASRRSGPWSPTGPVSGTPKGSGMNAFVVSGAADRTIQLWEVPIMAVVEIEQKGRESRRAARAQHADIGADSTSAGGSGGQINNNDKSTREARTWHPPHPMLETARHRVRAHEKDINCVAVSPNDAIIASASQDRTVRLWRARDLEPMGVFKGHKRGVWKVEFSPVDKCVATCSGDRTVKMWSIADCSCLQTFQGHTASVLSVAFVSAGAQLISGGADGLVKVWTIKSGECEATLDGHTDKVWALTTARAPKRQDSVDRHSEDFERVDEPAEPSGINDGIVVVSGAADSVINVWTDVTAREEEKEIAEKEKLLLKEQELSNRLRDKDFGAAIDLALELKRPQRLWSVLRDVMTEGMEDRVSQNCQATAEASSRQLDTYVVSWSTDAVLQCLGYCRDWNTNARKSVVVHAVVGSILRCFSLDKLKGLQGAAELVRVLMPYSERHFQRLDRLLQSSFLVEHTIASMRTLMSNETLSAGGVEQLGKPIPSGSSVGFKAHRVVDEQVAASAVSNDSDEEVGGDKDAHEIKSEILHGRVVYNVCLDPVSSEDDASDDDENSGGADSDVVMSGSPQRPTQAPSGSNVKEPVMADTGNEEGVDRTSTSSPPAKRRKRKTTEGTSSDAKQAAAVVKDGSPGDVSGAAASEGLRNGLRRKEGTSTREKRRRESSPTEVAPEAKGSSTRSKRSEKGPRSDDASPEDVVVGAGRGVSRQASSNKKASKVKTSRRKSSV